MLLLLAACATTTTPPPPVCVLEATTMLPLDEVSPVGFPAQNIVDLVTDVQAEVLYPAHPASTVSITPILDVPTARFEVYTAEGEEGGTDPCLDRVAIDGHYSFATDDGLFDESQYVPFVSWGGDAVTATAELDPAALGGTYTITEVTPSEGETMRLLAGSTWGASGHSGGVVVELSTEDADPELVEVALW